MIKFKKSISFVGILLILLFSIYGCSDENSNNNVEILIKHQEFIKVIIFENFAPFFIKIAVKGKEAYIGPAAIEPINIAKRTPITPDLFPIYFINCSRGTHTSINPNIIIIGGRTDSICIMLELVVLMVSINIFLLKRDNIISTNKEIKKALYLFKIFIKVFIYTS